MDALLVKDEAQRSRTVEGEDQIGPENDPALNDLATLAAQICETPVAVLWTTDARGVRIRASVGLQADDLSSMTLPNPVPMPQGMVFEIPDACADSQSAPDGLLIGGQPFCFYAAAPVVPGPDVAVGALAVLDRLPRKLSEAQVSALLMLARQAVEKLQLQERVKRLGESVSSMQQELETLAARDVIPLTGLTDEEKYHQLIEGSLGVIFTHDLDGKLLSLNAHGAASTGRGVREMVGFPLEKFVPAKRQNTIREYLKTIAATGQAQGMMHLTHSNGDVRVLAYRNKLIADGSKAPYVLGFGVDITEQVKAERKLRTLTRQSNSILEAVGDGIFCIDREGRVTVVNAAAAQMLGYRQEEMLGCVMHSLIHHTRADGSFYPMRESPIHKSISSFGTARVRDEVFWRKDGSSFPVEYVARPLIDANSSESGGLRALGVVVAFTDTTERRILDRMKDEFISTVSHELRTPLTSLRGALGLLRGGALEERPEKSRQMLEIAINNADRLGRLVNDIVDLERISSGKNELHLSLVRARELLHGAVNVNEAQVQGSSTRIRLRPTEVSVWADSERIVQVLNNLLSNAFKFSESDGEVHISVRNIDDQEALFEVRDFGRGISPHKLEHIFDRFQPGDASDSRALGGTGLGLTICHRIITLHGGLIWVTSALGQGTTVHFTLPTRPRMNLR
jgi:PAS domain S-box-containing protein